MTDERKAQVAAATVKLPKLSGQGVLVPGNLIVTAAHCVEFSTEGGMALGDVILEPIRVGECTFNATPAAVEPVNDVAALVAVDGQASPRDAEQFEIFCEATEPVQVCTGRLQLGRKYPVHILSHKGHWISGYAELFGGGDPDPARIWIEADQDIEGGTSGGPIVTENGELLGIVSHAGGTEGLSRNGLTPRPHLALPLWLSRRILAVEKK